MIFSAATRDSHLRLHDGARGRVHSSFASTTNLLNEDGSMWTVANPAVVRAPRTVVLERPCPHRVGESTWEVRRGILYFGRYEVSLETAVETSVAISCEPVAEDHKECAWEIYHSWDHTPSSDPFSAAADALAYSRFDALCELVAGKARRRRPFPSEIALAVYSLIGLGSGLTPVGDDLLSALLLGAATPSSPFFAAREEIVDAVTASLERTNAISAAFLCDAIAGKAPHVVLALRSHLSGTSVDRDEMSAVMEGVRGLGHSSGTAIVYGLLRSMS